MKQTDEFSGYHPIVNFIYFALVIGFSMVFMHPAMLFISLVTAVTYHGVLKGKKSLLFFAKFCMPLFLLTMIINPAFNHQGTIVLLYFPNGNALTFESLIYGLAAASMLTAVLLWFACFTEVMSSDKFIYLFGKIIPVMSLVLSMTLRFIPLFKHKLDEIRDAQRSLKKEAVNESIFAKLKNAVSVFSIGVSWALEHSIDVSDSMKARGYGLRGRTAYSIYEFKKRDRDAILVMLLLGLCVVGNALLGNLTWRYFPSIRGKYFGTYQFLAYITYMALCLVPTVIDKAEEHRWKSLR
ncbi:MAG: energy-coupling factor transporter transmembrane protein EcfT [Lachnospiraceae bacterium]|nr:energy-coupling factor transporter transmembrane protein EcfT [Lachnospiraceae bacterium]